MRNPTILFIVQYHRTYMGKMFLTLNKLYWNEYSAGKFYFDKYSYEGVREECLDEIVKHKFKYPRRCRKQFFEGKYQWRQRMGAGCHCTPEYK